MSMEKMKTFDDLQFRPWLEGRDMSPSIASFGGYDKARQAIMEFENGYGVSVLFGEAFYSNGIDTYEVAILKDGGLCYTTPLTDDVLGNQTRDEVEKILKEIQTWK